MNITEFQKEVDELFKKAGVKHPVDKTFIHLIEEIGEIARQLINEEIRKERLDIENLKKEISDSILFLTYLATQYNIDLEKALEEDIKKLKIRFNIN